MDKRRKIVKPIKERKKVTRGKDEEVNGQREKRGVPWTHTGGGERILIARLCVALHAVTH